MTLIGTFLRVMFVIDMLFIGCLSLIHFKRRKGFAWRLPVALVSCLVICYFEPALTGKIFTHGLVVALIDTVFQVAAVALVFWFAWELDFKKLIFILSFTYFIQRIDGINRIIIGLFTEEGPPTWPIILERYAFTFLVMVAIYFLYWRKIRTDSLNRMSTWQIITLVTFVFVTDVLMNCLVEIREEENLSFKIVDVVLQIFGLCFQYSILCFTALEDVKTKLDDILKKSEEQYYVSRENIEMVNIKAHDLRYKIQEFKDNGMVDQKSLEEINRTLDEYDSTIHVGKRSLDVILTEKNMICKQKGIELTTLINGKLFDGIEGSDIYSLFGNALDNAIAALDRVQDQNKKVISLTCKEIASSIIVTIENYFEDKTEFRDGLPLTVNEDKNNHGFGVHAMKHICEKYGGQINFNAEGNIFTVTMILPKKSA